MHMNVHVVCRAIIVGINGTLQPQLAMVTEGKSMGTLSSFHYNPSHCGHCFEIAEISMHHDSV